MVSTHIRDFFPHLVALSLCLLLALAAPAAASPTTELHIKKIAADGVSVIDEKTVDYRWLEANLPIQGDGVTHYYHQGPVFEGDPWNPEEDTNVKEKDMGAVKGTDLKDICELVGGMGEEDIVMLRAADGMSKKFPYLNVYEPEPRQGPMVITWYHAEDGYVPDYRTGMRLVFFADTSTNPDGIHAFGVWDMHECFDPEYWYFYNGEYPTTTGLSVQFVSEVIIYSEEEPTGSIYVNSTPSGAAIIIDGEEIGDVTPSTISGIEVGSHTVLVEKEGFSQPDEEWVNVVANAVTEVEFNLTPETGSIAVSSVPTNASIYLNGEATGLRTDTTLEDVPAGEHTVKLVMSGYKNATQTVVVEKDEYSVIDVKLSRESDTTGSWNGSIAITSVPTNASIYLNGEATGLWTDTTLEDIPAGEHTVKLVMSGYKNATQTVVVEKDECSVIDVKLSRESDTTGSSDGSASWNGSIAITSVPTNASIYLDGNTTEFWTDTTLKDVRAGEHTVKLVMPGYRNTTSNVTVEIGKCSFLDMILYPRNSTRAESPPGTGSIAITSVPTNASIHLDGKSTGTRTDAILEAVPAGEHTIELVMPGYKNATRTLIVEEDECSAINMVLIPMESGAGGAVGDESHDAPVSPPQNPWEAFITGILNFLSKIFPFFGTNEDLPGTPEQNTTPVPGEDPGTPVPGKTPVLPAATPEVEEAVKNRSGGLYIDSYPPGMTIVVDNKKQTFRTPHPVYGLREGLHSISVEESDPDRRSEDSGYRFETVKAWVYPDAITPVFIDGLATAQEKTIKVDSEAYQGEKFTVNGVFPVGTIPGDAAIEGAKSWITVFWNGTYLSHSIPYTIEASETFMVEPQDGEDTVSISIDSSPPDALVFIDGFPTGEQTPCRVEGLSPGRHRVLVAKPGYIPAEDIITIPEGSSGTGGSITCTLREYPHGDLLVESTVPDARIYLYSRYAGEKTPHTFSGMSIGSYDVRVVSENATKTIEDVLVKPGETSWCRVTLED
ncbi:PEGA domain-containing protein [Methanoculleus bourgensis]|uniref:PEGA domain-containing protein n=1 Tax=Methanoculleus bourgensis TaxID=83986 RepID=UPI003B94D637